MYRILAGVLLYFVFLVPAYAAYTPLYMGLQLDNISATALIGYQISKTYAVEMQYTKTDTHIVQSGVTADNSITSTGLSALAMLPMQLVGGSPYFLFVKAGYVRQTKVETYAFPASVTFSSSVTNQENRVILGTGAQYDFYQNLSGRVGLDLVGTERSVYLGVILKF